MVNEDSTDSPQVLKETGNAAYNEGDWEKALSCYTKAINLSANDTQEACIYYKNRAATYLKTDEYQKAVDDCTAALDISPRDPKALYRRSQAYEALEKYEESYRDAQQVLITEPSNKFIQPVLKRLYLIVQERLMEKSQTCNKVSQMFNIAFDVTQDAEKRDTAMNNLIVLARERAGADIMMQEGVMVKMMSLAKVEKKTAMLICIIRIISELCKGEERRCKEVLKQVGVPFLLEFLNSKDETQVTAMQSCLQTVLDTLGPEVKKEERAPRVARIEKNRSEIESILTTLLFTLTSRTMSGEGRDAIIELLMKNVDYSVFEWAEKLIELKGLERLMEISSEMVEYKYESGMEITNSTRTIVSVCLAKIYDNMYYDKARLLYTEQVDDFVKEKLMNPDIESKVRVVVAITTLLIGPLDVGNTFIAKPGILEMILVMANSDDFIQQRVACEALIAAASKKDKVKSIISQGIKILKTLYQSKNDNIKVRALVGLCKLGSSGGTDASLRPFADGSTMKLAEACRRFLINPAKDRDMRRWAAEGLSYLALDAEVKEKLIEDRNAIQALIELAKTGGEEVLYGVVTTLVNLTNSYDKQEVIPEMVELAKFAKMHIPEDHELDDQDFIDKRIQVLSQEGVTTALVALAKTGSANSRELISRVFNAICGDQTLRGTVVAQGGAKTLLSLAAEGTDKGKKQAAQALARIAITTNPVVAFPGQRSCEIVRPLVNLLNHECSALENFEALMGLCNLASVNDTLRKRILADQGYSQIEHYMYEDHEMLCRAALQAVNNMVLCKEVVKLFEAKNDRTKFLVLMCETEDVGIVKAVSGSLAILTSESKKVCRKFFEPNSWLESLHYLIANPDVDIRHRGVVIVCNLMASCKDVAEKLIETDIMELIMGLTQLPDPGSEKIRELAVDALKIAEDWKLIKKPEEDVDSDIE